MRMLMNNLDPEVAERPEELIVYGGGGKAARNWPSYHRIVSTLQRLKNDETLLVQSGKPVGVFRTHEEAPRVLIANANLVPRWATWDEFRRLDALGLTMYGQMTAGSWIYIGTQGILQGTYETFAECARQHFGGTLAGRLVVTGGLGGMGGAQPLAATMNGGRLPRRGRRCHADPAAGGHRLLRRDCHRSRRSAGAGGARRATERRGYSVGLVGNIAEVLPELVRRGVALDVVTDQTSAHDLRVGYIPIGLVAGAGRRAAGARPEGLRGPGARLDGGARRRHARAAAPRRRRLRLRQQPPGPGGRPAGHAGGVRLSRVRAGVHPAALLPRCGAVPLGGALRQSEGHRGDRRRRAGDVSRRTRRWPAGSGRRGKRCTSRGCRRGSAGSNTASAPRWGSGSTGWSRRGRWRRRSSSGATISTPGRWPRPTAKPRG